MAAKGIEAVSLRRYIVPVTTTAGGAATAYTEPVAGLVHAIWAENGDLDVGSDITITDEGTGHAIITITNLAADALYMPRGATHDIAGVAKLYAAGGTAVGDRIPASGRIKVVVAAGGATKSGTFTIYVEEMP